MPKTMLFLLLLASFFSNPAQASIVLKLSLNELTEASDLIVTGKCENVRCVWSNRKIYTLATIRVHQTLKSPGDLPQVIEVAVLGGRVKEPIPVVMTVEGTPQITVEEEMVLFLKKHLYTTRNRRAAFKTVYRCVGMAQGKLTIRTDKSKTNKTVLLGERVDGLMIVDSETKQVLAEDKLMKPKEIPLDNFLERVRSAIKEIDGRRKQNSKGAIRVSSEKGDQK